MQRLSNLLFGGVFFFAIGMLVLATRPTDPTAQQRDNLNRTRAGVGDNAQPDAQGEVKFEVTVRQPSGPPRITLAGTDPQGRSGTVACSVCHSVRPANLNNRSAKDLDEFHQGMTFSHGKLGCYACHNRENADTLSLADGTAVEYRDVMTLCSQCHGPQATAFAHGAHGGMNGFWDLSRGPQTKNNCVDCHDPHQPSFPKMIPTFKPRDRFLEPAGHESGHDSGHAEPDDSRVETTSHVDANRNGDDSHDAT